MVDNEHKGLKPTREGVRIGDELHHPRPVLVGAGECCCERVQHNEPRRDASGFDVGGQRF